MSRLSPLRCRRRPAAAIRAACVAVGVVIVGSILGGGAFGAAATAPRIVSLGLAPHGPIRTATVTAKVTARDPGYRVAVRYRWLHNGEAVANATSKSIVLSRHAFRKGDRLRVRVTAVAGGRSTTKTSAALVVADAAPKVTSLAIDPASPTRRDILTAKVRASDIDGDHLSQQRTWSWTCPGSASGKVVDATIALSDLGIGDGCRVSLSDRVSDGQKAVGATAAVTIANSVPVLVGARIAYDPSTATATITTDAADADGDPLQTSVRWTINGFDTPGTSANLDLSSAAYLGDVVGARVRVTDSQGAASGWVAADPVTISSGVPPAPPMNDWYPYTELNGSSVRAIMQAPADPAQLSVFNLFGFARSSDSGVTWSSADGPCSADGMAAAYAPSAPEVVYAGCYNEGPYRSDDGGTTWQAIPLVSDYGTGRVTGLAVAPGDPDTVFAVCGPCGIYRSSDGGQTWEDVAGSRTWGLSVAIDPTDADHIVVGTDDGVLVSRDGGDTWSGPYGSGTMMAAFDANSGALWGILWQASTPGVLRSADGGTTWTTIAGSPTGLTALAAAGGDVYVGGRDGDVSRSTDGGSTWSTTGLRANAGVGQVNALAIDATVADHVYVGFDGSGVWGLTFRPGLPQGREFYQTVRLDSVTEITPTSATLNATVAPLMPGDIGWIEWMWGTIVPAENQKFTIVTRSNAPQTVSTTLTGLTPNTTYHLVADGDFGNSPGGTLRSGTAEMTFTTPPA